MTIKTITITNKNDLPTKWWSEVKWLSRKKKFEFTPGINVICGGNGTGKSTLISLIAKSFHCEQGGVSKITRDSVDALYLKVQLICPTCKKLINIGWTGQQEPKKTEDS